MQHWLDRMLRAARLDVSLYEEVEADTGAIWQAMGVVVLSSLAAGIGLGAQDGARGIVLGTLIALLGWYAWAYLIYVLGSKLLPESQTRTNHGELLRTLGFASAPGLLRLFGVIPGLTSPVFAITHIWMLVAMIIAVRQALDYTSMLRAIAVCVLGLALVLCLILVFVSPLVPV